MPSLVFSLYPDQEACIEHLETVRWHDEASCPHCGSLHVARKVDTHRVGRWNCYDCKSSFNVLSGTIFEKTKIELQKWFLAIGLRLGERTVLSDVGYRIGVGKQQQNKPPGDGRIVEFNFRIVRIRKAEPGGDITDVDHVMASEWSGNRVRRNCWRIRAFLKVDSSGGRERGEIVHQVLHTFEALFDTLPAAQID